MLAENGIVADTEAKTNARMGAISNMRYNNKSKMKTKTVLEPSTRSIVTMGRTMVPGMTTDHTRIVSSSRLVSQHYLTHVEQCTVWRMDWSQCPACIFGDTSLTCTCNFHSHSPDYKVYEDESQFAASQLE